MLIQFTPISYNMAVIIFFHPQRMPNTDRPSAPICHLQPNLRIDCADHILFQMKLRFEPSEANKKSPFGKYLASINRLARVWWGERRFKPCLPSIARLKERRLLKHRPPCSFRWQRVSHLIQLIRRSPVVRFRINTTLPVRFRTPPERVHHLLKPLT